ncbi:hypothetical protein ACPEEZ_09965 [Frigoribacterium sp. 2-23]|uniref:hypothetical protein n=1 Tax=Frigoribacterium sp. 2-23 TaxID=3415006 RepID=UPI003C6EDD62
MARVAPTRSTDRIDLMIGFSGFFALAFFVITVVCEITGEPALTYALVLLALVVTLGVLLRRRGQLVRAEPEAAAAHRR